MHRRLREVQRTSTGGGRRPTIARASSTPTAVELSVTGQNGSRAAVRLDERQRGQSIIDCPVQLRAGQRPAMTRAERPCGHGR